MSDVYYIIGGVAYGIFILQFIISWVAGELDVDVDFDGDADFDIGDVVSFKGLIHFLMGFGGWTSIKQLLLLEPSKRRLQKLKKLKPKLKKLN